MANGAIPELQITGSTMWSTYHLASYGRLFFKLFQYCLGSGLGTISDFSSEQLLHAAKINKTKTQ